MILICNCVGQVSTFDFKYDMKLYVVVVVVVGICVYELNLNNKLNYKKAVIIALNERLRACVSLVISGVC